MSGHSKWSTIKHKKAATDAKRSKLFSQLARLISVASKEKGSDLTCNPNLRMLIEKAKIANMPKDNIDRAIKKGAGELEGVSYEEFLLEAYGPEKIAILIEGITDNKNRTVSEIKNILTKQNAKMANPGSVSYLFSKKGAIEIGLEDNALPKEELELSVIESGADDMEWSDDTLTIYTSPENLMAVKNILDEKGIKIKSFNFDWIPAVKAEIPVEQREKVEKLFDTISDHDDVQELYSNLK